MLSYNARLKPSRYSSFQLSVVGGAFAVGCPYQRCGPGAHLACEPWSTGRKNAASIRPSVPAAAVRVVVTAAHGKGRRSCQSHQTSRTHQTAAILTPRRFTGITSACLYGSLRRDAL